jgi:hypothetical protein
VPATFTRNRSSGSAQWWLALIVCVATAWTGSSAGGRGALESTSMIAGSPGRTMQVVMRQASAFGSRPIRW